MLNLTNREFYASPDDDLKVPLLKLASSAKETITIADYSFNMDELVPILVSKYNAGVAILMVLDKSQSHGKTEHPVIDQLVQAGIPVVIGESDEHHIMHDKVMVVDREVALYGSYNFTEVAEKEDNYYTIDHETSIAEYFDTVIARIANWIKNNESA